jgi:hypothetical protein
MNMRNISNITSVILLFVLQYLKLEGVPYPKQGVLKTDLWPRLTPLFVLRTHGFWTPKRAIMRGTIRVGFPWETSTFGWIPTFVVFVIFVNERFWVCLKIGNHQFQWTIIIFPYGNGYLGYTQLSGTNPYVVFLLLMLKSIITWWQPLRAILGGLALGFLVYPIYDCIYSYITGL